MKADRIITPQEKRLNDIEIMIFQYIDAAIETSSKNEAREAPHSFRIHAYSGNGTRTYDRADMSRLLYQLSYAAN